MGCLVAVGQRQRAARLDGRGARRARAATPAAPTFAPDGLYFVGPYYDAAHGMPERTPAHGLAALRHALTQRTRIKICGLTREADVDAAVEAGADAIGFVLYAQQPAPRERRARAPSWRARLPPFVTPVLPVRQRRRRDVDRAACAARAAGAAAVPRRRDAGAMRRRRPALPARRAHGAGARFARLRALAIARRRRPCCSTPMSRATAAAERSSIGLSFPQRAPSGRFVWWVESCKRDRWGAARPALGR